MSVSAGPTGSAPPKIPLSFYGWRIVGASVVGMSLSFAAFAIFAFSTFVVPLQEEFGWTRGQISVAASIAIAVSSIMAPIVGAIIDRVGVRRVVLVSVTLFGLAISSLFWLTASLTHFYAAFFILALVGAGTMPLSYSRVIVAWFDRKRGLALGLGLAGLGIGASALPQVLGMAIAAYGVRFGYLAMAGLVLLFSLSVAALYLRDNPADLGLAPDDAPFTPETAGHSPKALGFTLREGVRQPVFWLMVPSFLFTGVVVTGIVTQLRPMLVDGGFDAARAGLAASLMGLFIIVGRIGAGYCLDRFFAPFVAIAFLLGPFIAMTGFAIGITGDFAFVAAMLIGMAVGAEFDVMAYFISRYFGPRAFGVIYGFMYSAFQAGAAIGPAAMGWSYDRSGNYTMMLWVLVILVGASCTILSRFPRYPILPVRDN